MNFLEAFEYDCHDCGQHITLDLISTSCPHCDAPSAQDIADAAIFEASNYILIFSRDDKDGEYVNKKSLQYGAPNEENAPTVPVHEEFFDLLEVDVHENTGNKSRFGKVIISNQTKEMQEILAYLKHNAKPFKDLPVSATLLKKSNKKQIPGQLSIEGIDEVKPLNSSLQRDWKARTKPLIDNELFVDFD